MSNNSKPLKITDEEKKLSLAIQQKRLIDSSDEDLKQCLRYCFGLVGLRAQNFPNGEMKDFLHGFIRQQYGGHSAAEIRLAFEMAVTGKLDVDPVCYENFSPVYFAGIMNSYRVWASDKVRTIEGGESEDKILTRDQLVDLNVEYAFYLQKQVNKFPTTFKSWLEANKKQTA